MDLILASTSVYRRSLLERLRLPFASIDPEFDEDALKGVFDDPEVLALRLAVAKASAVAARRLDAVVVGGDQVVALQGRVLGKPGSTEAACEQLRELAGRTHRLITALAVVGPMGTATHVDVGLLTMRELTDDEIRRYVEADRPVDCAGAYKLESLGIALFDSVECADHTAIVGMPLIALSGILRQFGFAIP